MRHHHTDYPLSVMARLLGVSVTGYFDWLHRKPSKRQGEREQGLKLVTAAHAATRESYGAVRLHRHLTNQGHIMSLHGVRRLRETHDIRCKRHKRVKKTTNSDHQKPVYDNHLNQQFEVERPNMAWSCDITYVLTDEGWLYVAGVKDLHTKELVGYCLSSRMTADIVVQALKMAIKRRKPTKGLIVHSDRGSQYCSHVYRDLIEQHEFLGSMSAKGNCYDNAPIESFWATLKNELVYHQHYATRSDAIKDIQHFIEIFYNRMRIQAKLNFRSPAQVFEGFKMAA
jgi:transposase InsO family protein